MIRGRDLRHSSSSDAPRVASPEARVASLGASHAVADPNTAVRVGTRALVDRPAAATERGKLTAIVCAALPLAMSFFFACSSPPSAPTPAPSAAPAAPMPLRGPAAAAAAPSASAPLPKVEFHEDDFSETDHSRDPFRSFAKLFAEQGKLRVKSQRQVLLDHYAVDDLKLIGLVTRTDTPRAMLVDPTGRGWVVTKGQFICRPEVIHAGGPGGVDYELNWKIDRIRDSDLVLVREDPAHTDVPPATRVISLRPSEVENANPNAPDIQ